MKKNSVFIETYGCQMNEYDTQLVKSILVSANYTICDQISNANIVLLNTCSVRENANNKIYNRVHEIRRAKHPEPVSIGVLGCMATNFKTSLLENKSLNINFLAGPDSYKQLPALIENSMETGDKTYDINLSEYETYSDIIPVRDHSVNAWIAVMRGCNNFCTFCVVPFTRGRERSREPKNIVEEVTHLAKQGVEQVTLLGQNVNSYRYDSYDFADLMAMVSDIPGIKRIRYTSPHPKDFPNKFLTVMAERDNICNQVHMPLQSGNSRVLKKMNRTYTKNEYLDLINTVKQTVPNVSLSTDVIVGFPTETTEEFEDTLDVMQHVRFDQAFMFKYSQREQTVASKRFPDDVSETDKKERIIRLNKLQSEIELSNNKKKIGTIQTILIESDQCKKSIENVPGRTEGNTIVIVPKGNLKKGDWVQVKITDAGPNNLRGIPI